MAAASAPDGSTLAATSEQAASAEAATDGAMVNVLPDTTEEAMTWANPDGSFTTQETGGPTRIADSSTSSGWRDLDFTLVRNSDGSISPRSGYVPIVLSGAASASAVAQSGVVAINDGEGSQVKFGWNGALPAPTLSGDTATYTNVEPNLNIVVTLTTEGFEQNFVLTGPPTASELNLVLPLSTPGLTAHALSNGGINLADTASDTVGSIAPAFMWDARTDPMSGLPTDEVPLSLAATTNTLAVTSPSSFFSDPDLQYPVTIDPTYSSAPSADTYVRSDFTTTKYASYDPNELEVGTYNGGASVARAFLSFPTTNWTRTVITGASLQLYEWWSYSCTASSLKAEFADPATASTDWANQPARDLNVTDTISVAKGYTSSCAEGTVSIPAKNIAQYAATNKGASADLALVADESDSNGWKRFYSDNEGGAAVPKLTVTYEHTPKAPAAPNFTVPSRACGTATNPAYVNDTQDLALQSSVADADAGVVMDDTASVYPATLTAGTWTASATALAATTVTTSATSTGGNVTMTLAAAKDLPPGGYAVKATTHVVGYTVTAASSAQSTPCFFVVKDSLPALPTVSVDGSTSTAVGQPMQVKFTAPATDGPGVFASWWVDTYTTGEGPIVPVDGAGVGISSALPADGTGAGTVRYATPLPASSGDTTVSTGDIDVAPPDVNATLWVALYDAAGNVSTDLAATSSHSFGLPLQSLSDDPAVDYSHGHEWDVSSLAGPLTSTVADVNPNAGTSTTSKSDLTLGSHSSTSATANLTGFGLQPVFSFTGVATDTVTSAQQVVDTTQPFSVSAFVLPNSVSTGVAETAVSQAAAGSGSSAFTLGMNAAGHYEFCVRPQATPGPLTCAVDSVQASTTSAQFIEGVWDPTNQQLRLLETGSTTPVAVAWYAMPGGETSSTGPLLVGADFVTGSDTTEWDGYITNPSIFPGIVDTTEASRLSTSSTVN